MRTRSKVAAGLSAGTIAVAALLYLAVRSARPQSAPDPACCLTRTGAVSSGTLDPSLFDGPVRRAYTIARDNPALLMQLHCYCGCDKTDGHKNLLDCFRDKHGASCEICVDEAEEAQRLAQQGTPVEQIRDFLRERFAHGS
ncbi:MAG: CYCXC family (seleno)protein [Candidatus Binataceae bacterium]